MKNTQEKKISRSYHLLTKVESGKCRRVTAAMTSLSRYVARAWENESAMSLGRSALSREDSFSLADGNFELFSFSAYFSSSFLF